MSVLFAWVCILDISLFDCDFSSERWLKRCILLKIIEIVSFPCGMKNVLFKWLGHWLKVGSYNWDFNQNLRDFDQNAFDFYWNDKDFDEWLRFWPKSALCVKSNLCHLHCITASLPCAELGIWIVAFLSRNFQGFCSCTTKPDYLQWILCLSNT